MNKKILIGAIIIFLLGLLAGYKFKGSSAENSNIFRGELGTSESELGEALYKHHSLSMQTAKFVFENQNDVIPSASDELDNMSEDVGDAVGKIYGSDKASAASDLWKQQGTLIVNYATSVKSKDDAGVNQANSDFKKLNSRIAEFFSSANSNLSKEDIVKKLNDYDTKLKSTFNEYANKNYSVSFASEADTYNALLDVAKAIKQK